MDNKETGMTDYQFKTVLQLILMILKKSESLEEAIREIEKLIEE